MNWKETIISAIKGKEDLDSVARVVVKVNPEELLSFLRTLSDIKEDHIPYVAALINELGIFYQNAQRFPEAERAFKLSVEKCQNLPQKTPQILMCLSKTLTNLGIFYNVTGRFSDAEVAYEEALQIVKKVKGTLETAPAAIILTNMGNLYHDTQRFSEAEKACTEALKVMRALADQEPEVYTPDVALILSNLGLLYWNTKEFSRAEKAYTEAVEKYKYLASQNPAFVPEFASTLSKLGILYQTTQRFSEAEKAHREALEMYEDISKSLDVRVSIADTLANLGNLYWSTRRFLEAENFFKKSLKMKKELAEKNLLYTLDVTLLLNNMGNLYKEMKNLGEAEKYYKEALEKCRDLAEKTPDVYLPYLALILNNLGVLYKEMQQFEEAERAYTEALQIKRGLAEKNRKVYAADVAMTLNNVGLLYRSMGRFSDAKKAYEEALQLYWSFTEPTFYYPDIVRTLNNLGTIYADTHQFSEAEETFKRALELYGTLERDNKGMYALDIAGTLRNLGTFYRDTQRFDKAEKAYNEALEMYEELVNQNPEAYNSYSASLLSDLGILYQDTRKFYEAENAYKRALEIRRDLARRNPRIYAADVAGTLNNLGNLYNDAHLHGVQRFEEAEKAYREALEIFETLAREDPDVFTPQVAGTLNNVGAFYKDTQQFEKAEKVHKKALELRVELAEKNPDVYAPEVADSLTSLGILYEGMGRVIEAEKAYGEALEEYMKRGLWSSAANAAYSLSQVRSDKRILETARRLMEMAILFSAEKKYTYAQKGAYEPIYWGLLNEGMSRFGVLETLRDPEILSLSWSQVISEKDGERARNDVEFQKKVVERLLKEEIPSVKIPAKLPQTVLFIYVQVFEDDIFFFVIESGGIREFRCRREFFVTGRKLLYLLGFQLRAAGKSHKTYVEQFDGLAAEWCTLLPQELRQLIQEKECIVISPDYYSSFLPLEALQMDGESLCIEKTVVRATSLHQFLTLFEKKPSLNSSLIVGNPWVKCGEDELIYTLPLDSEQFRVSFLQGAQEEAEALKRRLPIPTVLLGQEATGKKFLSEVSRHSLIHFSGHGSMGRILFLSGPLKGFPPSFEPKEFSDLRKAARTEGTKRVNMMEEWHPVTDLDLFDVRLTEGAVIFLNACETGQHKYAGGGYYQGLSAVFLKNGAHSVVSSLIPLFDEPSKEFALHFYENLFRTNSVAIALKEARAWARNTYEAHIYWVPYTHYGSPTDRLKVNK